MGLPARLGREAEPAAYDCSPRLPPLNRFMEVSMSRSEFLIMQSQNRMTTPAFNIKTRVKPARKVNPFYNAKNAQPSPCVIIKPSLQS